MLISQIFNIYIFNTHTCYNCTITCPPATNGDVTNSAHLIKVPIENFQWKCPLLTLISSASIGDFNSSVFLYFFPNDGQIFTPIFVYYSQNSRSDPSSFSFRSSSSTGSNNSMSGRHIFHPFSSSSSLGMMLASGCSTGAWFIFICSFSQRAWPIARTFAVVWTRRYPSVSHSNISCNDSSWFHCNVYLEFCQSEFNICVRCDMVFIEPMHRNKPNITYLLQSPSPILSASPGKVVCRQEHPCSRHWHMNICQCEHLPTSYPHSGMPTPAW